MLSFSPSAQQVHDAACPRVEVDLERVAGGVPEEPGLVAAVGGGVVESRLGEGKHRRRLPRRHGGELGEQGDEGEGHAHQYAIPGHDAGVGAAIHPVRDSLHRLVLADLRV